MRALSILAFAVASLTAACGADNTTGDDGSSYNCATETRADAFTVGLEKTSENATLDFRLMTADPAPPARGDNTWVVQINSMSAGVVGSPLDGASLLVTPFMPDHQHGTPIDVKIMPMPTAGQYQLSPVNMWMPGLWETTINATAGGASDKVVYRFCIPS